MEHSKRDAEGTGPRTQESGHSREPDFSVPDFEIEPERSDHPHPVEVEDDAPRAQGFGGGRWVLLWLVITLGVASGLLLSNFITSIAASYQMPVVLSDRSEGHGKASSEAGDAAGHRQAEQGKSGEEGKRDQSDPAEQ